MGIIDMAVIVKDGAGKLKITNSRRRSTRGLVTGGVVGGLVGLLAGPVGWVALGGGAIGALAGKVRGAPLKRELQDLGESLTPNSSAIVAVVEHTWVTDLQRQLAAEGAKVVHDEIKADIAAQLEAGGSVLYTAVGTSAGGGVARVTEKGGQTSATVIAADDDGVYIEQATLTDETPPARRRPSRPPRPRPPQRRPRPSRRLRLPHRLRRSRRLRPRTKAAPSSPSTPATWPPMASLIPLTLLAGRAPPTCPARSVRAERCACTIVVS